MSLNCFWKWESVSLCLPERWCQTHWNWDDWWTRSWCRGTMLCFNHGSQMKAYCPHEHSAATGHAGCHLVFPSSQGLACSLAYALFPFLMDGRLQALWVGVGACFSLAVLPRANWHYKRAEYQWFLTAEWLFSGAGIKHLCFSKHRRSP